MVSFYAQTHGLKISCSLFSIYHSYGLHWEEFLFVVVVVVVCLLFKGYLTGVFVFTLRCSHRKLNQPKTTSSIMHKRTSAGCKGFVCSSYFFFCFYWWIVSKETILVVPITLNRMILTSRYLWMRSTVRDWAQYSRRRYYHLILLPLQWTPLASIVEPGRNLRWVYIVGTKAVMLPRVVGESHPIR